MSPTTAGDDEFAGYLDEAEKHPPEAFPNSGEPIFLTTNREAQEDLPTRRRHIFKPVKDDKTRRIYVYDAVCNRKNAPIGLRGHSLEPVPPLELLFSHLIGSDRVCDTCRRKSNLEAFVDREALEAFIEVTDFPADLVRLFGDADETIEIPYALDLDVEVRLPDGWWTNQLGWALDQEFESAE